MVGLIFNGIAWAFQIYTILLVIYILMSWVPSTRETKFGQFLAAIVEPYLGFFRKFIPPLGMIDISPIVALFALSLIRTGVFSLLSIVLY
ncbi:YggT family protein [Sporosarcina sp. YIM B06819]|uniref:YggT family protein n=1 Tax=Sporosarcina sp. YIM B06819 TaxID=3081769 RepID=UPI00298C7B5E|nr:YggT family protein [Sporosarcina sp. YIM B06819]